MIGTLINGGAILSGSLLGYLVGQKLGGNMRNSLLQGLGLITMLIGLKMALETKNILLMLGSVLLGAIIGELLKIDYWLEKSGNLLQLVFQKKAKDRFSEGFVTASIVFCTGPMAILGAIQDGLSGNYQLLGIKSVLDGVASVAFSATLGFGVAFSSLSILLYQGAITIFAVFLEPILTEPMILELTATGGLIIIGIGLKMLNIVEIRLANFLPALVIAPLIVKLIPVFKSFF
jgi:uncharacterized membrane protein YqgA involved in biofilm formation